MQYTCHDEQILNKISDTSDYDSDRELVLFLWAVKIVQLMHEPRL